SLQVDRLTGTASNTTATTTNATPAFHRQSHRAPSHANAPTAKPARRRCGAAYHAVAQRGATTRSSSAFVPSTTPVTVTAQASGLMRAGEAARTRRPDTAA